MQAIIFDMDGVIVDSEKISHDSFMQAISEFNLKLTDEDMKVLIGSTLRQDFIYLKNKYKINIDIEKKIIEKQKLYCKMAKGNLKVFPGAIKLLRNLKENNIKLAVATSGNKIKLDFNLNESGVGKYFDVFVKADDIKESKPNPEIFLKAAEKLNVKPNECVVIEDSINGIKAAKNAKMKCIAVTNSFSKEKLKQADIIVDSLQKLNAGIIKKLGD